MSIPIYIIYYYVILYMCICVMYMKKYIEGNSDLFSREFAI